MTDGWGLLVWQELYFDRGRFYLQPCRLHSNERCGNDFLYLPLKTRTGTVDLRQQVCLSTDCRIAQLHMAPTPFTFIKRYAPGTGNVSAQTCFWIPDRVFMLWKTFAQIYNVHNGNTVFTDSGDSMPSWKHPYWIPMSNERINQIVQKQLFNMLFHHYKKIFIYSFDD